MQPAHLAKRASKAREETTAKVLAALLAAGTGGLTVMEMMTLTGLSEGCCRKRVQELRGERKARVCDYRLVVSHAPIEAWGLGSAPSLTVDEWRKRTDEHAEEEMRADVQRKHACWAAKWKPRRAAEEAWI
ncbi:hypothetical protein [Ralstonia insidiosa]|uniref:hypothetical protein n=1 Tax=Ralstonia insidiosa TaxID=190721 RepID=UPI000CEDCE53|nr:hypothetical protein [Ralstonia insidiosa]